MSTLSAFLGLFARLGLLMGLLVALGLVAGVILFVAGASALLSLAGFVS